jgi:dihydroxy-acid dehydratase
MGSASTGQVLAEALGLALPGSALTPVPLTKLLRYARAAGKAAVGLIQANLTARRILTRDAFENAIILHAAVGGSTNALLHLPVIAREAGVDITIDDFDRIHRRVPVLANVKTTGRYPVEYFWYAGGVPAVMIELRDMLHQNCLTVTGKTLGENLDEIAASPVYFAERRGYLRNVKVAKDEIIRPRTEAKPGGELQVHGSGALIRWLLENHLVDEITLLIVPVVLGQGTRLFPDTGPDIALDLVESRADSKGITIQVYRRAGRPRYAPALPDLSP